MTLALLRSPATLICAAALSLSCTVAAAKGDPPVRKANAPVGANVEKASTFQLHFGGAGEAAITSIAMGGADASAVSAQCSVAFDQGTQDFLAAWQQKVPVADNGAKPVKRTPARSPKRTGLSPAIKEKLQALTKCAATWQLSRLIAAVPEGERAVIAQEFLAHPKFSHTLALLVDLQQEDAAKVDRLARMLMAQRSEALEQFPELAAAIAVVHDAPVLMQVNENVAKSAGPIATLDHFVAAERALSFGVRAIAPELLLYIVDVAATSDEMAWALRSYAGHASVGDLYDKVEYDFDNLEKGSTKKVNVAGWTLPNILRFGGICADQAYFATTVGKSIGVPCVYSTATDGVLSHAWIGFVRKAGRRPQWDEVGRFGGYQSVEGFIRDPQSGEQLSNTQMPMLVEYGLEPVEDRLASTALRIAAEKLLTPTAATPQAPATQITAAAVEQALALTRVAVQSCLTDARAWELVGRAAATGAMTTEQKQVWSADVLQLCGDVYPEFAWRTIAPMIHSIADITQRQEALDGALSIFQERGDLAGQILLQQAALYMVQGNLAGAGLCYEIILDRYPNDGPFAIVALQEASAILAKSNDARANVILHERAFRAMEVPVDIAAQFSKQSNWYRAGVSYSQALRIVGREQDAAIHEQRMGNVMK
ncbi:MAG: hypothetical protein EXS17_07420 [Phycisphaerales bacterium]|nr:hypothetical protein [Phycisphaerales bacterium]